MKKFASFLKSYGAVLLCALCCIFSFGCFTKIRDINNRITQTQNTLSSQISSLSSNISSHIHSALEAENTLVENTNYSYGEADFGTKTIPVRYTVALKEYSPSKTKVSLFINEKEYPMSLQNSVFALEEKFPIDNPISVQKILIQEEDTVKSEVLYDTLYPKSDLFNAFYMDAPAMSTSKFSYGKSFSVAFLDGPLTLRPESAANLPLKKADIVLLLDGKEIERLPAKLPANEDVREIPEMLPAVYDFPRKKYEIPFGSNLQICAEITDSKGLIYFVYGNRILVDSNGDSHFKGPVSSCNMDIYNSNHELLFSKTDNPYF